MSRSAVVIITGLILVGSVVAFLPAQESSRRTAAKYRPGYQPAASSAEPANLSPMPGLAPVVPPSKLYMPGAAPAPATTPTDDPGLLPMPTASAPNFVPAPSGASRSAPQGFTSDSRQFISDSGAFAPATASDPAAQTAEPAASNQPDDASQLRSVLKRNRPAVIYESPAPQAASPQTTTAPPAQTPPAALSPAPPAAAPPRKASSSTPAPRRTATAAPAPQRAPATDISSQSRAGHDLAAGSRAAALRVEIAGAPGITVGKPASYVVTLINDSESPAADVLARMTLPSWVSVNSSQPSAGDASLQADAHGVARLVWSLPHVAARSREQLQLQLVTAQGEGFDLGVEYTCRPAFAKASIAVKQPQLELSLAGPAEMTFGEDKTFTLTVSNPGTGDAERVMVTVTAGDSPPQTFDAGSIPAGHKKELPLQVVASQPGTLEMQISATAESGLEAQTAGKINVRKAEVSLAVEGPPLKYAGTEAVYVVTVANSGTAAADHINLALALPAGAKYLGGIEGASPTASGLKWLIATLAPGSQRVYEVRLQLNTAGTNQVVVQSQASSSGAATSQAETEVEAVADLKLVVNDPPGPLPTDEQAVYELQVMNRGSQAARQVKIVVQFGDGIEPVSFEGCEARIVPGQVVCHPLAQLGAGEQITLRVKARAERPGTHQFRIEVTSTDGDARLVSEGTTRFFSESGRSGSAATTAKKPSLLPAPSAPGMLR